MNKENDKTEQTFQCESCGENTKVFRLFDVDGKNLVEALVCLNCRYGELPTKECNDDV